MCVCYVFLTLFFEYFVHVPCPRTPEYLNIVCRILRSCLTLFFEYFDRFENRKSHHLTQDPKLCTWEHVLDHDAAEHMWDAWKLEPHKCPYVNTMKGGIFYVRIPTMITVDFETAIVRENSVEAFLHRLKNPSAKDLSKHVGRLQTDMGNFGQMGSTGMDALGAKMIASGGPRFGDDLGSTLGKITNLVKASGDEPSDDDDEEPEGQAVDDGPNKKRKKGESSEATPDTGKEAKWWNKAAYQIAREADIKELVTNLHSETLEAQAKLKKSVQDVLVL